MEMGTRNKVGTIKPEGEIYTCPTCGYTDGFHVSFNVIKTDRRAEIFLICPNCHNRFKLGWHVDLSKT
jgi:DNA-directed RNA polymerase subunit M/transcription elongation factor TFIIS